MVKRFFWQNALSAPPSLSIAMPLIQKNIFLLQGLVWGLSLTLLVACGSSGSKKIDNEGLTQLGDQLHNRGDDVSAADFYTRALQHDPKDMQARKSLAGILEAHGNNAGAAAQYTGAINSEPDNGELRRDYGRVLLKLNQPEEAKKQYQKALDIDADDIKALNGFGVSLDLLHDHVAAQAIYRQALEDHPDDIVTLANLGHSYVLSGAWEEAFKLLEPHLSDKDATPAFRQNLAEAYGMAGMDADAERIMRMDLPPERVKHNIAYYRAQRKQLDKTAFLTADLGHYPTQDVAEANAENIRNQFTEELEGLTIAVTPTVKSIGSTPAFALYVKGFEKAVQLRTFCDRLKKGGFACAPRTGL